MSFESMHNDYLDPDKYGLFDDELTNEGIVSAFPDYNSLGEMYRSAYKYTPCGPSIGALIRWYEEPQDPEDYSENEVYKWVYGDDLYKFGTFKDMEERGELIYALCVSSIVEGVDQEVEPIRIDWDICDPDTEKLHNDYYKAIEEVDNQANSIWMDTHGCETCAKHWIEQTEKSNQDIDDLIQFGWDKEGNFDGWGYTPVWLDCPDCEGHGEII